MDTPENNNKQTPGGVDQPKDREVGTPSVADPLSPNEHTVGARDGGQDDDGGQDTTGRATMMTCPVDPDLIPSDGASLQGTFVKDLLPMMIGFGDDETPLLETAHVMEVCSFWMGCGALCIVSSHLQVYCVCQSMVHMACAQLYASISITPYWFNIVGLCD